MASNVSPSRRQIVGYYRVSTRQQGADGLGMEAQRRAVEAYAQSVGLPIVASYHEVETGRRSDLRNRPQLTAALSHASRSRSLLVIARLNRLARNVYVTARLLESGVDFVACDVPFATRMTIQILAVMAEYESHLISERIKAANAAARARGVDFRRPGNRLSQEAQRAGTVAANIAAIERSARVYADLVPLVIEFRAAGASLQRVAEQLNAIGHATQRGTPRTRSTIYTLLTREGLSLQPPLEWIGQSIGRRSLVDRTQARYAELLVEVKSMRANGFTLASIADDFDDRGLRTFRGCRWTAAALNNLIQRQGGIERLSHRSASFD